MNNPSALIQTVPALDGNSVTFPSWRNRLQNVLQLQGVLDIVNKSLPRPNNSDSKENKSAVRSPEQQGYNPKEYGADWDALSDMACSTIQMTLLSDLTIRYESVKPASKLFLTICDVYKKNTQARRLQLQDAFWMAPHNPNQPIKKWIARIRMAASDLASVKLTLDHLVNSPNEVSLDDAVGAIKAHKISTTTSLDHSDHLQAASAVAKAKGRPQCYTCGEKGHHSSDCPNKKKHMKASARLVEACAGTTTVAQLGNYNSNEEDDDSFDDKIDGWG
ncbi:uncharacterized protein PGTG_18881 [Puccinia graminis f. sp. tritici CRL 75-36-700-3]|uniref:CCHC-type domain-containing protein n=1 Tax=Puccinia graminis f. sp. tritici (strain CRL 75-36-700-3 / race SCCL) TaxID=418459 RepID=E3L915_PUCGT|nr:uncharacterized protein PGTG_18881 [Puccinia graminis f. sp. tritici CRL 75-36-700-3]EFP93040.2 hypothetical protein PGTG_18881 [Puccinia graminis f. sp. tritici CRL 75-36-700-3]